MTETNQKIAAREELERAREARAAARLLSERGLLKDAVSRLCYFVLYNVRSLLISIDAEPRSHTGAARLFALHFVKSGLFPTGDGHLFSKLMKFREEADYNPAYQFGPEDFNELLEQAGRYSERVRLHLQGKGLLSEE